MFDFNNIVYSILDFRATKLERIVTVHLKNPEGVELQ